jgi:ryanodine receptor 2
MEPETKVFPAIFVEATSKEVLQIELGRTSTTLPLSAALLQNSERHVVPQVKNSIYLFPLRSIKFKVM